MAAGRVACLVAAFLACALGGPVGAPGARRPRPALLRLRGGQEALLDNDGEEAELPAPAASAAARARANIRAGKLPTPAAKPRMSIACRVWRSRTDHAVRPPTRSLTF